MKILLGLILPILILIFAVLGCSSFESAIGYTGSPEEKAVNRMHESDEKKDARANISAETHEAKNTTKNVLILDVTIDNVSEYTIKDVEIECYLYAASNTRLQTIKQTVFQTLKSKEKKIFKNINFGFKNTQTDSFVCLLDDFQLEQ